MADSNLPRGLIVELITPLTDDGSIDGKGLDRHLERMLESVNAVFISGPRAGEGPGLSMEQRIDLFDKTLVIVGGAVPVMVWITGQDPENTREILSCLESQRDARKYKGAVFWVDSPIYYHSNRGLPEYYNGLCSGSDTPLILHNDPGLIKTADKSLGRNNIRTSVLKELAMITNIGGLIFSGSLDRSYNYRKAVRNRPGFKIYDGDESRFLDHPGLSGVVSIGANIAPVEWGKITDASLNTDTENVNPDHLNQIWDIWSYLVNLMAAYAEHSADVIKKVLSDMSVIHDSGAECGEDILKAAKKITDIMH